MGIYALIVRMERKNVIGERNADLTGNCMALTERSSSSRKWAQNEMEGAYKKPEERVEVSSIEIMISSSRSFYKNRMFPFLPTNSQVVV